MGRGYEASRKIITNYELQITKFGRLWQKNTILYKKEVLNWIYHLSQYLLRDHKEFVLSKQVLKSGTSIGANIEEAIGGQTRADFFAKITIAYKEARETQYWIKLLREVNLIDDAMFKSINDDCSEICNILAKIQKTVKNNP